jgi:hypothetical protein
VAAVYFFSVIYRKCGRSVEVVIHRPVAYYIDDKDQKHSAFTILARYSGY